MEMYGNQKLGFHEDISHAGHTHVSDEALNSLKILKLLRDCLHGKWKDISAATLVDIFRISRPNWCVLKILLRYVTVLLRNQWIADHRALPGKLQVGGSADSPNFSTFFRPSP